MSSEIVARFQNQHQRLSREIKELKHKKQHEISAVGKQFQDAEFNINSFILFATIVIYITSVYFLWNFCKAVLDVLAYLPYIAMLYWFQHCLDFEHGLVLQCWNESGRYYREPHGMLDALADSGYEGEICISWVFPCFIVRGLSSLVWILCSCFYGVVLVVGLIRFAVAVKYAVRKVVSSKSRQGYQLKF